MLYYITHIIMRNFNLNSSHKEYAYDYLFIGIYNLLIILYARE